MMPLAGKRVVVTRPAAQAQGLAQLIRAAGGEPLCVPAIEIREIADARPLHEVADRLASFDLAIFVSRNAVRKALAMLRARRGGAPWPGRLAVATVGQGSREELLAQGFGSVIAPAAQADSEALLAQPELASVRGKRIVIFRGDGGRQLLGDTLRARGASIEYVACYQRVRPEGAAVLHRVWDAGIDAVTLSSAEGLANFIDMLGAGAIDRLKGIALFVPHARVAQEAAQRGLGAAIVTGPRDADVAAALVAYFKRTG